MDFIKRIKESLVCCLLLALYACNGTAREKPAIADDFPYRVMDTTEVNRYREYLSYYFDTLLNYRGFSGGILVAKNGQVLYEHYQGDVFGDGGNPINDSTPFHVASTSKTFTSTAILQLLQQGRLSLDDTITHYFHDFPYRQVTIRNLLTHSSGIGNYANFLPRYGWSNKKVISNREVLDVIVANKPPLEFAVGSRFRYCNTNFVLLALIVEQASGLTFPEYVQQNIFQVAGMRHSYVLSHHNPDDYLPSWNESGRIYNFEYLDGLYGDKNVMTTCRDLLKYDEALRKGKLVKPELLAHAWQPNYKDGGHGEYYEFYGLGWRLKIFNNNLKIPYHNGWWHGNNAVFQRLVADTAVVIVTGNRFNRRIYASARVANLFRPYFYDSMDHRNELEAFLRRTGNDSAGGGNEAQAPKSHKLP
ncbi:MAG: beta-lactamase family protein [Chitinophagaceae bacterium]|nr:beta-lactamase family protein [Chitinophagaceae bacterium]